VRRESPWAAGTFVVSQTTRELFPLQTNSSIRLIDGTALGCSGSVPYGRKEGGGAAIAYGGKRKIHGLELSAGKISPPLQWYFDVRSGCRRCVCHAKIIFTDSESPFQHTGRKMEILHPRCISNCDYVLVFVRLAVDECRCQRLPIQRHHARRTAFALYYGLTDPPSLLC